MVPLGHPQVMIRHFLRALPFAILVWVLSGVEARMGRCVLTDHRTGGRHRTQSVFTQREKCINRISQQLVPEHTSIAANQGQR